MSLLNQFLGLRERHWFLWCSVHAFGDTGGEEHAKLGVFSKGDGPRTVCEVFRAKTRTITGDEAATALCTRAYRPGWEPKV